MVSTATRVEGLEPLVLPALSVAVATIWYLPSAGSGVFQVTAKLPLDVEEEPMRVHGVPALQLPLEPAQ